MASSGRPRRRTCEASSRWCTRRPRRGPRMAPKERVCVVLMTFGSPATLDDIPTYLKNVRGGRDPDDELITEFRRRYELIGGSPLIHITRAQAEALEAELN